jgi:hypothetical protein
VHFESPSVRIAGDPGISDKEGAWFLGASSMKNYLQIIDTTYIAAPGAIPSTAGRRMNVSQMLTRGAEPPTSAIPTSDPGAKVKLATISGL